MSGSSGWKRLLHAWKEKQYSVTIQILPAVPGSINGLQLSRCDLSIVALFLTKPKQEQGVNFQQQYNVGKRLVAMDTARPMRCNNDRTPYM